MTSTSNRQLLRSHGSVAWALIALALAYPQAASAEEPGQERHFHQRTLLDGSGKLDHGGYGGFLTRGSSVNGDPALFVGARGGWLIDHRLLIGAAGMGQTLTVDAPAASIAGYPDVRHLEFGYGGGYFAYHFMPGAVVHPVASVLVGAGGLTLSNRHYEEMHDDAEDSFETAVNGVFIIEPEVALEVNVAEVTRLQGTLSYRRTVGVDLPGLGDGDASGLALGVSLLFGSL
jgi:hypothetical protein